ncbi:hypothetical protein BVY00_01155 [bacterium G20]|nr:hypothetical protein BVY00_01155 [bacterium G20]
MGIAGILIPKFSNKAVGEPIGMVEKSNVYLEAGAVVGPHVIGENGSSAYYPNGIMLYKR